MCCLHLSFAEYVIELIVVQHNTHTDTHMLIILIFPLADVDFTVQRHELCFERFSSGIFHKQLVSDKTATTTTTSTISFIDFTVCFLVQMTARNRVNVLAINVSAEAIGLRKTAVCTRVQIVVVLPKDVACVRRNIADALM